MKNTQIIGISWMILHCLLISSVVVIAKLLGKLGYSSIQIVFFHSFVAFLLILPLGLKKYGKDLIKTQKLNLHLLRSFFGAVSLVLYFSALKYVNLNDARAVVLFNPVITFIFGIIFIKEHINNKKIAVLVLSLIGGFIIINPTSPTFHVALFLVIVAMFIWSAMDLVIKEMSKTESKIKQLFFLMGLLSLFSLLPTIYFWKTPSGIYEIFLLIFIGVLFLFNSLAIFSAIKYANLTTIMPFDFSGMVFTAIISYAIFSEVISFNTLIGSIIVFISSLYLIYHESRAGKEFAKVSRTNIAKE
jgi:drug/metabolite transporter (DMT)-like permease